MISHLLHTWNLSLAYAQRLVADVPDEMMAFQPASGMNHAAWVLGHLACTGDMFGGLIGIRPVCPSEWQPLFDWNSTPVAVSLRYPSKGDLLAALEAVHSGIAAALPAVPASRWAEPMPIDEIRGLLPTLGDGFVFVMTAHENMHLGQLSAWRRVQGMGRV